MSVHLEEGEGELLQLYPAAKMGKLINSTPSVTVTSFSAIPFLFGLLLREVTRPHIVSQTKACLKEDKRDKTNTPNRPAAIACHALNTINIWTIVGS